MMMETLYKFTQELSLETWDMGHGTCDMTCWGGSGDTVNTGLGLRGGQVARLS